MSLGFEALTAVTTGVQNTGLGNNSGNSLTTGSNNTIIGNGAQAAAVNTSNSITFGDANITALRSADQSIAALSDKRDKTDIVDLPHGLDFIDKTRPVKFKWDIRDADKNNTKQGTTNYGFIAQELQEIGNNEEHRLVYEVNSEKLEARYSNLIPIMTQAIKELSSKVNEMKTEIEELKKK